MKSIILAAGYATRLYPLTLNKPKALLPIAQKPIINYIVEQIEKIEEINELIVISNDRFYANFLEWKNSFDSRLKITILNDYTTSDDDKLGAVGDISYIIDTLKLNDDLLIMAGDNIFTFELIDFYNFFKEVNSDVILVKRLSNIDDLRRMANVELDENNKVISMVEKPQNPKSDIAAFASYIYKQETLPLFKKYLNDGNNPDAPGFFPSWLQTVKDVYAFSFDGECYDIGTPKSYEEVDKLFSK